ncbi:MAG: nucleotidyltransferase family protein [Candidatus Nanoarchaeia archaeon]
MKAILPAAGYATRLQPLTLNTPKALLQVGPKKMVEHVIHALETIDDIDEIHIVTNEKFYQNFVEWNSNFKSSKTIILHNDGTKSNEDRLGTLGDIHFVLEQADIKDDCIIINADNLFEFSLKDMCAFFKEKKGPSVAVLDLEDPSLLANKFGTILSDENGRIIDFEEKPAQPKSSLAATGVYMYTADCMDRLRALAGNPENKAFCDKSGHFIQHLMDFKPVYAYAFKEKWYDVGSHDDLREAHKRYGGGTEYDE